MTKIKQSLCQTAIDGSCLPDLFFALVGAMFAAAFAAISTFEMVCLSEDHIALFVKVEIRTLKLVCACLVLLCFFWRMHL